jgi:hypothetical protein
MRRAVVFLASFCLAVSAFAGFKVKLIKPKAAEQFQTHLKVGEVTYAADLLIEGKDQKSYFYKELTPAHVIAVRLAVFNQGRSEVVLPLDRLQLLDPSGREVPLVGPDAVAQAVLRGLVVTAEVRDKAPVQVAPTLEPRLDPNDPRNNPNDPRYDPRAADPRYNPNDPRYGRYPNGTYGPYLRPGVDVVLNPGGGGGSGDLSRFEKSLVEKDFNDKAHTMEPVLPHLGRDKFLYFSFTEKPASVKGFTLRLPQAKGMLQEVVLQF